MIELPDPHSSESIADWVELQLTLDNKNISRGEVSGAIEATSGSEPSDVLLSDIWRELSRREGLYAPSLFKVRGFGVRATGRKSRIVTAAYQACLLLSLYGDPGNTMAKLFERITRCAVEKYLNGRAVVFGWGEPGNIGDRVRGLADQLGEQFAQAPRAKYKDRGVDVVGWKPFVDTRSGQTVLLTQCAAGLNWVHKSPIPHRAWEQYIHWAARPDLALSIPSIVSPDEWHDRCLDLGVLFDRVRLMNLIADGCEDSTLVRELSAWTASKLSDAM